MPFVQDGFRDGEAIREWMHERIVRQLENGHTPWQLVEGPYSERVIAAEEAVLDMLSRVCAERVGCDFMPVAIDVTTESECGTCRPTVILTRADDD